jgi:pimeloyl-ACP methyl ester carboxylesterase
MKRIVAMLIVLLIVAVTPAAADNHFFSYDIIFPDVYLKDGGVADINVPVLKNTDQRCDTGHKGHKGKSIIALHGLANTASTWKPLASELFSDNPIGKEVCSILAINLPGRGHSGLPEVEAGSPFTFGHLTLDDHAQAVIGTLERIRLAGFHPKTIMAHSRGGKFQPGCLPPGPFQLH